MTVIETMDQLTAVPMGQTISIGGRSGPVSSTWERVEEGFRNTTLRTVIPVDYFRGDVRQGRVRAGVTLAAGQLFFDNRYFQMVVAQTEADRPGEEPGGWWVVAFRTDGRYATMSPVYEAPRDWTLAADVPEWRDSAWSLAGPVVQNYRAYLRESEACRALGRDERAARRERDAAVRRAEGAEQTARSAVLQEVGRELVTFCQEHEYVSDDPLIELMARLGMPTPPRPIPVSIVISGTSVQPVDTRDLVPGGTDPVVEETSVSVSWRKTFEHTIDGNDVCVCDSITGDTCSALMIEAGLDPAAFHWTFNRTCGARRCHNRRSGPTIAA